MFKKKKKKERRRRENTVFNGYCLRVVEFKGLKIILYSLGILHMIVHILNFTIIKSHFTYKVSLNEKLDQAPMFT